uniref:Unannotated protein n=1 Tax=freshwater metagenome TaxID=449393 RepID=A0A6J5ZY58_9ZZZZ
MIRAAIINAIVGSVSAAVPNQSEIAVQPDQLPKTAPQASASRGSPVIWRTRTASKSELTPTSSELVTITTSHSLPGACSTIHWITRWPGEKRSFITGESRKSSERPRS